jgi:chromosome segregation ATPase
MRGVTISHKIKAKIAKLEEDHERLGKELSAAEKRLPAMTREREQAVLRLAQIYLPKLGEESVRELRQRLPGMQARIDAIVTEKGRERAAVEEAIDEAAQTRKQLDQQLQDITATVEAKATERDALRREVQATLDRDAAYAALIEETQQAKERLLQSGRRLRASINERDEKIPAYRADPLFKYLLARKYGTDDYRGGFLTSRLDRWVARTVDYRNQYQNYTLLHEVPEVMRKEVAKSEAHLKKKGDEIRAKEQRAADHHGLTKVLEEGEALYGQRVSLVTRIAELDRAVDQLVIKRRDLDTTTGTHYEKALRELSTYLRSQDVERLQRLARSTDTRSDDGLAARVEELDGDIERTQADIGNLKQRQHEQAERLQGLRKIESGFRQSDFDASNSEFRGGLDIDDLLSGFLSGLYTIAKVMRTIARHQRFRHFDYVRGAAILADILMTLARLSRAGSAGRRYRGHPWRRVGRGSSWKGPGLGGFPGFGGGGPRTTGRFGGGGSRTTGGFG